MRIGLVNDVPLAVEALRRAVVSKPGNQVLWVARNGAEAVAMCEREKPDLILMDLLMPTMDGVEATKRIMASTPCPILVVTVSVGANAWRVFEAMGHGALDAVDTPKLGSGDPRQTAAPLLAKIDSIGRLISEKRGLPDGAPRRPRPLTGGEHVPLVAIGASAGGPAALMRVLSDLPPDFPAAVAIIQHVDQQFAAGMAEWLGAHAKLPVRLACPGDLLERGTVLLAGTNDHLTLTAALRLAYTPEPREYSYRPSVDVFFRSVSQFWSGPVIGVLLTGMGRDGALGLKVLRNDGNHTIAQDQATCAVYGMPKAAVALNAAVEVLPLDQIAPSLVRVLARRA